ncbi:MAG: tetratricopeptide repeat protein [Myxococcota bacterium]|nr:tetratricopeptide repeat protein [Myxococcota bacterium]
MMWRPSVILAAALWASPVLAQTASEETAATAASELPTVDQAQATADALVEETKQEVVAFKGTVDRFIGRMREFNEDARDIIQTRERDERAALIEGYSGPLAELRTEEVALRDTAISRLENFLVRYPRSTHTPHAMFLLGDLYYEESEEAFAEESKAYERIFAEGGAALENPPEPPMRDHGRALRLFNGIVEFFPEYRNADGAWYMLGFIRKRDETLQSDERMGRDAYLALVDSHPTSEFAAAAHMALGEHFFDNHDIDRAIHHYSEVVDGFGTDGQHYEKGLYKLAWSHYKLSNYDVGLDLLAKLLDWSEENFMRSGKRSAMAPEAVEYTAISFSDQSDQAEMHPVDVAKAFYSRIGEREYENKVYDRLANVLMQQARYAEAITAYDYLIQRWPTEPENPTYMWTIAKLYRSLDVPDHAAAQNTITRLNELFNRDSAWAHANRNNPDALAVADGYIEESLAAVAIDFHNAAKESGDPSKYGKAADLYSQYLNKFPFAKDYYEIQWYLADTLLNSGRLREAAAEYVQLLKGDGHPYRDGSMWNLMQVRRQSLIDKYGTVEALPADAVEEERVALPSGATRSKYTLSDDHLAFIESADMLVDATFSNEDYAGSLDEARSALAYLPGQILYYHGHLDEARERLNRVIDGWPSNDEAAFAASLIVDSFQDEEDLAKVRLFAGKFARMTLGTSEAALAKNLSFTNLEEGAAFKMAALYIEQGEREKAAEAFLSFMSDFPRSEYIKEAHYNAANNYEIVGAVEKANELFRQYVDKIEDGSYDADGQAWPIYERIAQNYSSALELDEAVRYFEMLYNRSAAAEEPYEHAPAALYNAGFLRIGLGDHRGAAVNLEKYANENRDQLDAESVMWSAADQWALVSDEEAESYYNRYLDDWGTGNPDHAIAAHYELAQFAEARGDRNTEQAWEAVMGLYDQYAAGDEIGPLGRHYAAAAAFRPLQRRFDELQIYEFSESDDKNAQLVLDRRDAVAAFTKQCGEMIKAYPDFDYSSAAQYLWGASQLTFAKLLFEVPEPQGFDDEMLDIYYEQLDEMRIPVEDRGKARLVGVLEYAQDQKRWSEWTSKALDYLAVNFPTEYAKEVNEVRGVGDSTLVPTAGPIAPTLTAPREAPEAPADEGPAVPSGSGVWQ